MRFHTAPDQFKGNTMMVRQLSIGALLLALHTLTAVSSADSAYLTLVGDNLVARDLGDGQVSIEGGFSVSNGQIHWWNAPNSWSTNSGYHVMEIKSGTIVDMGQPAEVSTNGYGDPFGLYDPVMDCFYAATYYDGANSMLYKYSYATGQWASEGTAVNLYGGSLSGSNLYISGLRQPWTGGYDNTFISLYDLTGQNVHDALIEVGGASAHVAVDGSGNVYYATYDFVSPALYRWTAEQVAGAINDLNAGQSDTFLTLADGEKLADLGGGANGLAVDAAGNVFFTYNGSQSVLGMWNGISGDGYNYDVLAVGPDFGWPWFGPLAIEGNFLAGDPLYGSFGFGGPITEITYIIPEPATLILLALGGAMAGIKRRWKRSS